LVVLIERIELLGIYVENSDQITLWTVNGQDDLGTRSRVTRDVTRKFPDVRHDHRLLRRRRIAANSATKSDLETSERTLVGSHPQ
jgi:hypothetical protein